jgi:hypothetical protein
VPLRPELRGCDSSGLIDQGSSFIGGIGDNRVSIEITLIALLMIFEHRQLNLNFVQPGFLLLITIEAVPAEYGAFHSLSDKGTASLVFSANAIRPNPWAFAVRSELATKVFNVSQTL